MSGLFVQEMQRRCDEPSLRRFDVHENPLVAQARFALTQE